MVKCSSALMNGDGLMVSELRESGSLVMMRGELSYIESVSGRVVLVILRLVFLSLAVSPPTLTLFYNSHQVTNGLCSEGSNISIFLANELFSRTGQTAVFYPICENMTNVLQQLDPMYEEFRNTMSMTEPAILASTLI